MAKQNLKEKYGFEGSSEEVAGILWRRLFEFIKREDRNNFCIELRKIAKLELLLQGERSPKESVLQAKINNYFIQIVPTIYDSAMTAFKKLPKTYSSYDEGELEEFEETECHFYRLDYFVKQLAAKVRSRYRK